MSRNHRHSTKPLRPARKNLPRTEARVYARRATPQMSCAHAGDACFKNVPIQNLNESTSIPGSTKSHPRNANTCLRNWPKRVNACCERLAAFHASNCVLRAASPASADRLLGESEGPERAVVRRPSQRFEPVRAYHLSNILLPARSPSGSKCPKIVLACFC
jgi:hypothetical protein